MLDAAHVEVLNVVPEVYLAVLVLVVLDRPDVDARLVGEHKSALCQESVSCHQDRVEHTFLD